MTLPTYILSFAPCAAPADAFTVRLERRGDDGTLTLLAPAPGTKPYELPLGWQDACALARRTPASPPIAFVELAFDLGSRLQNLIGTALAPVLHHPARIVLCAGGNAAAVPWEALATEVQPHNSDTAKPSAKIVATAPFLRGQWHLMRRPPGVLRTAVPHDADRRALLLVGSLATPHDAVDPLQDVARIARAMGRAGFRVTIAAGRPLASLAAPQGLDVNEWLDEPARVAQLLRDGGFTLLHYVGHAADPAVDAEDASPAIFGAEDLRLEIRGEEKLLAAADLAAALAAANVRCAVFSACDLREAFAAPLLRGPSTALEHILSMGARVPIAVCADWSEGFYDSLREQPAVAVATSAAAARLRGNDRGRRHAWLPQHWSSTDVDLTFADDERVLIERVCRRMLEQLDRFEGRFHRRLEPARLADVYVDLFIDPRRDEEKARKAGETLDPRDPLPADPKFDALLSLAHTRAILLGGAPGAGKSTTLRVCARKLADNPLRACVPLFVALVDWLPKGKGAGDARYPHLLDFLAERLATGGDEIDTLRAALRKRGNDGELAFFLDGLDELSGPARTFLDQELTALRADFARSRFVVSSRRYEHSSRLSGFVPFDIRPLRPERAAALLANVLRTHARTREAAERVVQTEWLPKFAHGPRTWLDLGKVPLFVTLIGELLVHRRQPGDSRVAFFREVFAHLCLDQHHGADVDPTEQGVGPRPLIATPGHQRDPDRDRARVDAALDVLAFLALKMTEASRLTATKAELAEWIRGGAQELQGKLALADVATDGVVSTNPGAFLRAVSRLTLILAPDVSGAGDATSEDDLPWRFWHRSFQEALTARRLFQMLAKAKDAKSVVRRMRIEPNAAELEAARIGLLAKWRGDDDAFWNDFNETYVRASADEARRINSHRDPADGRYRSTIEDELAAIARGETAKRVLLDFWIEPAALLLAMAVEESGRGSPSSGAIPEALLDALLRRDQGLGRNVVEVLDRCPATLFARALAATSRSDADVSKATNGTALYEGLTLRLSERRPLYRSAALAPVEPEHLVATLQERIRLSDDPGELFLIDAALAALAARCDVTAARSVLQGRFGKPSAALYREWFVRLEGGTFRRGSEQGEARERPVRDVTVSPFAIGRTAVTVAMFREFFADHRMEVGKGIVRLAQWKGQVEGEPVDAFPVTYVSWWAAQMFCRWLQWHRSTLPDLQGWSPSLPTEAEREFAARGGTTGAYSFGDDPAQLDRYAWFQKDAQAMVRPHAVALKLPNPSGLFDMHGGVWEWCLDAYGPYAPGRETLADALAVGSSASARVLRGGSFFNHPDDCRSANRVRSLPANASRSVGFRVVLAARPQLGSEIDDRS